MYSPLTYAHPNPVLIPILLGELLVAWPVGDILDPSPGYCVGVFILILIVACNRVFSVCVNHLCACIFSFS